MLGCSEVFAGRARPTQCLNLIPCRELTVALFVESNPLVSRNPGSLIQLIQSKSIAKMRLLGHLVKIQHDDAE